MSNEAQPIIKKVKKGGHDHAHSAAWKVAYADFVTAMMAFFLLLWLLNASSEEQRAGIADYFLPSVASVGPQGSVGFSGGLVTDIEGPLNMPPMSMPSIVVGLPNEDAGGDGNGDGDGDDFEDSSVGGSKHSGQLGPAEATLVPDRSAEERQFKEIEEELMAALGDDPELQDLAENIEIDRTHEGLRIQIVDHEERSMFPLGSDQMYPEMRAILGKVAQVIGDTTNRVSVSGHTDATPYRAGSANDNWTLSSSRANAARKVLSGAGLDEGRLSSVSGKADTEPHLPQDPLADSNRRISIVLLYLEAPLPGDDTKAAAEPIENAVQSWSP